MQIVLLVGLALTLSLLLMLAMLPLMVRSTPEEQRLQQVVKSFRPARPVPAREQLEQTLLGLAVRLRGFFGFHLSSKRQKRLEMAGYRSASAAEYSFAASWLLPLAGAVLGSFIPVNTLFFVLALMVVGYMVPDVVLSAKTTKRRERIRRALPDAMDLMVICVDAGLGLDQAMMRVGEELALSAPELHEEFLRVHAEQQAGSPRLEAWARLSERLPIDELKTFVNMLIQADRFGTPLAKGLSRFAEDLRTKRRQRAEEAAAKTKIKIIFPLVFFIFPSLFIVLLAPALLSMFHELAGATR